MERRVGSLPAQLLEVLRESALGMDLGCGCRGPGDGDCEGGVVVADVKKPDVAWVVIGRRDSELEQFQKLEMAAAMVGGQLGQAVLAALATMRDDVIGRAL